MPGRALSETHQTVEANNSQYFRENHSLLFNWNLYDFQISSVSGRTHHKEWMPHWKKRLNQLNCFFSFEIPGIYRKESTKMLLLKILNQSHDRYFSYWSRGGKNSACTKNALILSFILLFHLLLQNNISSYTIWYYIKISIIRILMNVTIASIMWIFIFVNLRSRLNIPIDWLELAEQRVTTSHYDVIPETEFFLICLQNLPLTLSSIPISTVIQGGP